MANLAELPYDVIRKIIEHAEDDLGTLHSLPLTSKRFHDVAAPKAWNNLRLTTESSVASILRAILKKCTI